ncbi:pentatricopeptide repeat-containing protein At4g32450, mitochondrial-like [Rutidosis leptorrhynchoides]|uniref:pentatricopeptide repeat-containing protein At4g32450, mitochondrial-like n=1 Tax=Rutidosis leptorrhynchoides TaxID=125765 RepID=UPI003A99F206
MYRHHRYYCKVRDNTLRSYYSSSLRSINIHCYTPINKPQFNHNPDKSSYLVEVEPRFNQNPNKTSYFCETEPQFNQNCDKHWYLSEAEPQCNQSFNKSWYVFEHEPLYFRGTKPEPKPDYDNYLENKNVTIEELDGFCKERKLKEAVEVLGLLEKNNVLVDLDRYMLLLNECGEAQALEEGRKVHESLVRSSLLSSSSSMDDDDDDDVLISNNKILEMYAKCGSVEDAYNVFDKTSQRDVTCWDKMITLFVRNGHGEDAINMFTDFKRIGLKPDSQMFFGVFSACSVVGDMKEGLLHFESMSKQYDIVPSLDHYKSVVDMLGSAGYLNEALQFIEEKMPIEPSVEIWETLMNNCRVHGNMELGDRCLELIELLDPARLDEETKAGLIPIKASDIIAKETEDKRSVQMRSKVGNQFSEGETCYEEDKKLLYDQLRCLKKPMIEAGYILGGTGLYPHLDQESKEEALFSHGERLALSLHLLTTPARSPVRILRKYKVCYDCHAAFKIISKIVGRLIIVHDSTKIHYFDDGASFQKLVYGG